jgi:hypothetical protein
MMTVDYKGRRGSSCRAFATAGTMLVATVSALFLMTGCNSSPQASAFAATPADKAAEARLKKVETMPHLAAYDEGFHAPPAEDETASAP